MSGSDRGKGFAIVTAVLFTFVAIGFTVAIWRIASEHGAIVHEQGSNARNYAARAEQDIEDRCLLLDTVAKAKCISEIIQSTNEHQRAEKDLIAQTEMSLWAFWMVVISCFTVILTGVGVWFVFRTAQFTHKTLIEAEKTTKAAIDTVDETRRIGESQTRAYIEFHSREFIPVFSSEISSAPIGFRFRITIKNSGQTPAHLVRSITTFNTGPNDRNRKVSVLVKMGTECEINQKIGAGTTYYLGAPVLPSEDIRNLPKDSCIYIFGLIEYRHIFSKSDEVEVSKFCFSINFNSDPMKLTVSDGSSVRESIVDYHAHARFSITNVDEA